MVDYKRLEKGLGFLVGAYSLWYLQDPFFDSVNILKYLPWWLAGPCFFEALGFIQDYIPETKLLKPLCLVMSVLDLSVWLIDIFDVKLPFELYILQIISSVINLYFTFQLMTNLMDYSTRVGYENTKGMKIIRDLRIVYVTVFTLLLPFYEEIATNQLILRCGWYSGLIIVYSIESFEKHIKALQKENNK